jgi:glycosyltransferase involved in cell wall biosynthesis
MTLTNSLGIKDKVIFAGYQPNINIILKQSYIALFPCDSHAGMVEAIKYIPLVSGNGLTQREYIINNKTGLLCENKVDDYVDKISLLLDNPSLRNKLQYESRKLFYEKFCINTGINKFIELYEEVLKNRHNQGSSQKLNNVKTLKIIT